MTNERVNGLPIAQLSSVVFNPYWNDLLQIDFDAAGTGTVTVGIVADPQPSPLIPLQTYAPLSTGTNSVTWDGRLNDGTLLRSGFSVYFAIGGALAINPIILRYGSSFASVRTNPYLFHPTLAEVTNLRYTIAGSARVGVDVIDPNGSFVTTLMSPNEQPAGTYEIIWDGRNPAGAIVTTPGSYTLQLSGIDDATGRSFSRRATVLVAP